VSATEVEAYVAISRLQRAYADVATRRAWHEVPLLLMPDAQISFDTHAGAPIVVDGPAAFVEFGAKAVGIFGFYEYIPLNFVATINGDGTARGRSYALEVAQHRESGAWIEFYGAYEDEYATLDGSWRFSKRAYRTYGRRTDGSLQSYPLLG
jgi:SnoaL-like domain